MFAVILNNVDEFCIVKVASGMQTNQIQQPLVLSLIAEKSQAVVEDFEIMAAFMFSVHQLEHCHIVLIGRQ